MSPAELLTLLSGSRRSSQVPATKRGRNFTVGSISTAQWRRVATTAVSSGSRYFSTSLPARRGSSPRGAGPDMPSAGQTREPMNAANEDARSEEQTSELQSRQYLVCRLLLEKKKKKYH